jgi:uracil-DNA glycosylase
MYGQLPADWRKALTAELAAPSFRQLQEFLDKERAEHTIYPPEKEVYAAFHHTPYAKVKVLLLGQDPYHGEGQAHGLCFSVRPGVTPPPSLRNIFRELHDDVGCPIPKHGCLVSWADQGILLLNAVLTVRAGEPASHANKGWEAFTDGVIREVSAKEKPVVFVLWGAYAQKKTKLIDIGRHTVVAAAHPSPLSAKKFFGCRCFSTINKALEANGETPIDWALPKAV